MIPSKEEKWIIDNLDNAAIYSLIEPCTKREKTVLECRLINQWTYSQIGQKYGVTRERVRQIKSKGLKRIRQNLIKKSHKLDQEKSCGTEKE